MNKGMMTSRSSESPAVNSAVHIDRLRPTKPCLELAQSLGLVLLPVLLATPALAQDLDLDQCYRVPLSQQLEWPTSGIWTDDHSGLLVADASAQKILSISQRGWVTTGIANEVLETSGQERSLKGPSQIRAFGDGFLVEDEDFDDILRFDRFRDVVESTPVKISLPPGADKQQTPYERKAIYDWSPMGQGILAFGDLQGPRGWTSAFFYFDGQERLEIYKEFPIEAEVADHYTRNIAYVASFGDVGYILFLDEMFSIGEVRLGAGIRQLSFFPQEFQNRPRLDEVTRQAVGCQGIRKATEIYKSYEKTTMASGLYSWDRNLYLLAKEAIAANGETMWWLIRVDPEDGGREVFRVRLPTNAAHLTVVPGADFWALIEKGQVRGLGTIQAPYMETASMVLVPAPWLETVNHGRLDAPSRVECKSLAP